MPLGVSECGEREKSIKVESKTAENCCKTNPLEFKALVSTWLETDMANQHPGLDEGNRLPYFL
jgi:hypothetical protein